MPRINPFAQDPVRGESWELGYLAGFAEPEEEHFLPLAPELLHIYLQGEQAGRDDRRLLPPDAGGVPEEGDLDLVGAAEEFGLHALGHVGLHRLFGQIGGLVALVVAVLELPTDSPMRPLDDAWTGPVDAAEDTYLALCPRRDHAAGTPGVTPEGYWTGPQRFGYVDAVADLTNHGHAEAGIARCNVVDGECGLVWPGPGAP